MLLEAPMSGLVCGSLSLSLVTLNPVAQSSRASWMSAWDMFDCTSAIYMCLCRWQAGICQVGGPAISSRTLPSR